MDSQVLTVCFGKRRTSLETFEKGDMESYLHGLPPYIQRLLAKRNPSYDGVTYEQAAEKFHTLVVQAQTIFLATDGCLSNGYGTFGVVLAGPDREVWENSGPVDGDPATSNSKRSELVGFMASLELLIMLWTPWSQSSTFDLALKLQTVTWMDSAEHVNICEIS